MITPVSSPGPSTGLMPTQHQAKKPNQVGLEVLSCPGRSFLSASTCPRQDDSRTLPAPICILIQTCLFPRIPGMLPVLHLCQFPAVSVSVSVAAYICGHQSSEYRHCHCHCHQCCSPVQLVNAYPAAGLPMCAARKVPSSPLCALCPPRTDSIRSLQLLAPPLCTSMKLQPRPQPQL